MTGFRDDERLIVFTEYKTTLDYLATRLRMRYREDRVLTLFGVGGPGGMGATERDSVKAAFNDPDAEVRILVATDAASEGLNLHRTARYLLHYDCPWNPSRLEQRNGRLDRYGQARDVTIHHFDSAGDDSDIRFLAHVIRKANDIREDLGSANELFDRAMRRRLIEGEDSGLVQSDLDLGIGHAQDERMTGFDERVTTADGKTAADGPLRELADAIGLNGRAMADTLESAMVMSGPPPQLEPSGEPGLHRLRQPGLPEWKNVIDRSVRRPADKRDRWSGAGPAARVRPRSVHGTPWGPGGLQDPPRRAPYAPGPPHDEARVGRVDAAALSGGGRCFTLDRPRGRGAAWGGGAGAAHRRGTRGERAPGDLSSLGANGRVSGTRWRDRRAARDPPPGGFGGASPTNDRGHRETARDLLVDAELPLRHWIGRHQADLTERLRRQLETDGAAERKREDERYRRREGEVSTLIEQSTIGRLAREIASLKIKREQGQLFDESAALDRLDRDIEEKEREIERRRGHYEEIREQLGRERARILNRLLPGRYALAGEARVFPVTTEVRLPGPVARRGSGG